MSSHHAVTSTVTSVCVFHTGAQIQRTAGITVPNKTKQLSCKIGLLPISMYDQSLQFSVTKGHDAYISNFRVGLEVPNRFLQDPNELRTEIKELRRQRMLMEHRQTGLQDEINELKNLAISLRPSDSRQPPPPSPHQRRLEFMAFRTQQLSEMSRELIALNEELKENKRHTKALEEKLARNSSDRAPEPNEFKKSVYFTLSCHTESLPQQVELQMSYQVPGARWAPAYALKLTESTDQGHLALRAVVCQSTGEDWKDISLKLSTAFPLAWHNLPKLKSHRIGRKQSSPPISWQMSPPSPDELFKDFDHSFRPESLEPVPRMLAAAPQPEPEPFEAEAEAAEELINDQGIDDGLPTLRRSRRLKKPPLSYSEIEGPLKMRRTRPNEVSPATNSFYRKQTAPSALAQVRETEAAAPCPKPFLDYSRLRLASPDDPKRGTLRVINELEVYHGMLSLRRLSLTRIETIVAEAIELEKQCLGVQIPDHYHIPTDIEGFDFIYSADLPVDVPSDRTFHSIPLCSAELQMEMRYICAPRELQKAFRTVRITNPFTSPLLSGPIDVYSGNEYLLTADLPVTPQGGKLSVGIGIEESIRIARNFRFREEASGLMKGDNDLVHDISIDITNHLPTMITLELRERVPTVAEDEKLIKVKIGATNPQWKPFEQEGIELDGGYCWVTEMAPGERRQFNTSYTISISSKNILVGGNRRER